MGRFIITKFSAGIFIIFLGFWIYSSIDLNKPVVFTKYENSYIVIEKDDIFGTEVEKTKWEDGFWFGLLPPSDQVSLQAVVGLIPVAGIMFAISLLEFLLIKFRKGGRKS